MKPFCVRHIADALGVSLQAVRKRAKREGWDFEWATGLGGKQQVYQLESLPVDVQVRLLKRDAPPAPAAPARPPVAAPDRAGLWDAYDRRPQSLKDEAARRLSALQAVERLVAAGTGRSRAVEETAKAFGESRPTLYRWAKLVAGLDPADWLAALVPAYTGRTTKAECDERAWDFFKAEWLRDEAPSIATAYDRMV